MLCHDYEENNVVERIALPLRGICVAFICPECASATSPGRRASIHNDFEHTGSRHGYNEQRYE